MSASLEDIRRRIGRAGAIEFVTVIKVVCDELAGGVVLWLSIARE
jgi:hypothetical protein